MRARQAGGRLVAAFGSMLLAGCVAQLPQNPALRISNAEFRQRLATLCMVPVRAQLALPDEATKLTRLENDIAYRLTTALFRVIPSTRTAPVMEQAAAAHGGSFDPHTGLRDPLRDREMRLATLAALREELGCDATLTITVAIVSVPFFGGQAQWDGVAYTFGGTGLGWTTGLSLWMSVRDLSETELMFCTGGIETIVDLDIGFFSEEFVPVADEALLADQGRIRAAIDACLAPLLAPPAAAP